MHETPRTRSATYGLAVLATALTLLIRWALMPVLGERALYSTFLPAIAICAYFGGIWPGLLATGLSALSVGLFVRPSHYSPQSDSASDAVAVTLFVLVGAVISGLSEALHRSRQRVTASERRYAVTLASIGDAVMATDTQARVTFLNPVAESLTGWSLSEALGRPLADVFRIVNEQTRQPVEDPAAKVLRLGTVVGLANHTVLLARDGREGPIDDCGAPIVDERGVTAGVVLVFRDENQRRQVEEAEAFRRAKERMELALRGSSVGVWDNEIPDGDYRQGRCHYVNFWEQLGYEGRPAGSTAQDAIHPDDRVRVEDSAVRYLAGGTAEYETEARFRHSDGSYRTLLTRGVAVRDASGNPTRFAGVTVDITQLKLVEEELRRTTQLLQAVIDGTQDAVYVKDRDGRHLMFNAAASRMVGKPIDEVLGRDDTAIFDPDIARAVMAHDRRVMESGAAATDEKPLTAAGVTRTYLASKAPYRDGHGNVVGIIGICHDITERKRIEEALRESEQRWRGLTEALPQLVWANMPDGSMDYASAQVEQYLGRPQSDLLAWGWLEVLHPDDRERTEQAWQAAVAGRSEYEIEHRLRRFDGTYRWFKTRGVAVRDGEGHVCKWFGTCTDINDLRQTQEALRQANARVDLAVRGSNISIWECDMPDGRIENSHPTFINVWEPLGYDARTSPPDFPSVFAILFHPDDQERVGRELQELFAGDGQEYDSEYRVRRKDGSTRWHLARGTVLHDREGKPVRFIGTSTDITDLKRAEEALRESERRFRTFVDHAADAFFLTDDQDRILDVNRQACEGLGYTRDELIGMTPLDFVDFEPTVVEDRVRQFLAGEAIAFESRHRRKDGTVFPVETRGKSFREGGRQFLVTLTRDVTERKRLEEEVRLASARLELALRGSNIGFWDIDMPDGNLRNGRIHSVNIREQLGYERPDSPKDQEAGMALVHPDDRAAHAEAVRRYLAGETSEFEVESRVCHKDGSFRWMISRGVAVRDTEGKPIRFLGTGIDITDRKQAEEALQESEERFRQLAENVRGVFWLQEGEWERLLYISPVYEEFWGRTCRSLYEQPRSWIDSVHPEDRNLVLIHFEQQNRGASTETDFRVTRPDGSKRWMRCRAFPLKNQAGEVYRVGGLVEDITERRQFEDELRRTKEAAEGANRAKDEFLANVSHEIRTPMNAILGMTELALDTPLTEDQRQYLKAVKSGAESLLGIINDLLDFSKIEADKMELEPAPLSLRAAVGDILRVLAGRAHKKGVELAGDVHPDVPDALVGDAGRLRQVLLNLVGNAIKFTVEGEVVVRVKAAAAPSPEGEVGLHFEVRDTGIGIAPDKRETIFRAFEQEDTSTTRKYGGTGLGLTIASRLVTLMGGTIGVQSEPGRGSTFTFTVRLGRQSDQSEPAAARPPVRLYDLRVLVVDDNATNRQILEGWLRDWQMEPYAVGDGLSALNALWHAAAAGRPYPLVLLDARMPDTDGLKLAAMIRERAELSATRLILLTSGDRPGDPARARELQIDAHLLKPVQPDELLETIARVMNHVKGDPSPAQAASVTEPVPAPPAAAAPLRVLVAEDNELSASLLEKLLARRGHEVALAGNGRQALALAGGGGFDLVLLDVHMPEMDGFQVVGAIRRREQTSGGHLPVIALTARSRKEDRERCLAAGADDFLPKPIRTDDLWAAIDRIVNAFPPTERPGLLIDPRVLQATCDGDPAILQKLCQTLHAHLPQHFDAVRHALRSGDVTRLRDAAHLLWGTVAAFSTSTAAVVSELEERAAQGRADECGPLADRLEPMVAALLREVDGVSADGLREQATK